MPLISVIIPVYKSEKFIEKCVRSLMAQTLDNIELIFVNDCTPDNSMKILCDILSESTERNISTKILNNPTNKGTSFTRLRGISEATGDYLLNCDSDDWLEPTMLEEMYSQAISDNADIVVCDYVYEYEDKSIYRRSGISTEAPSNTVEYCYKNLIEWVPWNKLIKRTLWNKIDYTDFPCITMWEDPLIYIPLFTIAYRVSSIAKPLYHYNQMNENSVVRKFSDKDISDLRVCIEYVSKFLETSDKEKYALTIKYLKFSAKTFIIQKSKQPNYRLLTEMYPESNDSIMKFEAIDKRYRYLYLLGSKGITFPLKNFPNIYRFLGKMRTKIIGN